MTYSYTHASLLQVNFYRLASFATKEEVSSAWEVVLPEGREFLHKLLVGFRE